MFTLRLGFLQPFPLSPASCVLLAGTGNAWLAWMSLVGLDNLARTKPKAGSFVRNEPFYALLESGQVYGILGLTDGFLKTLGNE